MNQTVNFSVSHARDSRFAGGLRGFFEYRDLGIEEATAGRAVAHVIRAVPGGQAVPQRHRHEVELQLVYVLLKGWIKLDYEGVGEVLLTAGSCVHQPPGIRPACGARPFRRPRDARDRTARRLRDRRRLIVAGRPGLVRSV